MTLRQPRRLVIGIGNPDRGDDAAGRAVARYLRDMRIADVAILEHSGEATSLLAILDGATDVILVDACVSHAPAGTMQRMDVSQSPLPSGLFAASSHGFGLAEAVELARALGQLPPRCIVYAIEGAVFDAGAGLSPAVATAIPEVARRLCAEIVGDHRNTERNHA